jgi:hypothetical protein
MSKFTLAMLLALAVGEALAAAARVDFVYGVVTVAALDGREQPLLRGAELNSGDTVRTAEGRAQLRFSDGAYVSLQPQSEFAIRDYRFDGKTDGSERGFFGLLKGAMRAVSGLVGRVNRDNFQVTTPTATIGIRGTGWRDPGARRWLHVDRRHERHLVAHQPGRLDRRAGRRFGARPIHGGCATAAHFAGSRKPGRAAASCRWRTWKASSATQAATSPASRKATSRVPPNPAATHRDVCIESAAAFDYGIGSRDARIRKPTQAPTGTFQRLRPSS